MNCLGCLIVAVPEEERSFFLLLAFLEPRIKVLHFSLAVAIQCSSKSSIMNHFYSLFL